MNYLGHVVGSGVLAVPKHRITALENFPMPQTKEGLRSFPGVISYYRKFVSGIANSTAFLLPPQIRQHLPGFGGPGTWRLVLVSLKILCTKCQC